MPEAVAGAHRQFSQAETNGPMSALKVAIAAEQPHLRRAVCAALQSELLYHLNRSLVDTVVIQPPLVIEPLGYAKETACFTSGR